ncbi:DUF2971 domain-containing protein [Paenibacillus alkalitolerans]|uniref:DUF2971 domain-containing protein n=1 Tax=Paenibacillus alkalitolerans TaxID=2799335 RepID=UPI0018F46F67|nr:DUF2971 domain-containing protein [Paenibacillus alkalitolerans]
MADFGLDKYREEHPMDYLKAIELINSDPYNSLVSDTIYKITRLHIPDTVYKYFSLTDDKELNELKFKTIEDKKIYLASPKELNDPFESNAYFYRSERLSRYSRLKHVNGRIIDDFASFSLFSSFTSNGINSMPMWAHYANNHRGFCLSYDLNQEYNLSMKGCMLPVQYTDKRIDITPIMETIVSETLKKIKEAKWKENKTVLMDNMMLIWVIAYLSCLKHVSWSYEKELRVVIGRKDTRLMNAGPSAIYIGMSCTNKYIERLKQMAKKLNIPIYKMQLENYSLDYEFSVKQL